MNLAKAKKQTDKDSIDMLAEYAQTEKQTTLKANPNSLKLNILLVEIAQH